MNLIKAVYAAPVNLNQEFAFGGISSLGQALGYLAPAVFALAAVIVTFYFLFGAVKLIMSGGNKEDVAQARAMITHAVIGILLLIMVFLILQYLPELLRLGGGYKIVNPS